MKSLPPNKIEVEIEELYRKHQNEWYAEHWHKLRHHPLKEPGLFWWCKDLDCEVCKEIQKRLDLLKEVRT